MWTHWECYVRPPSFLWEANGCDCWPHRLPNDPTLRHDPLTVRHVWGLVRHTFPTTGAYAPVNSFSLWCGTHHTNTTHQHTTPTHHPYGAVAAGFLLERNFPNAMEVVLSWLDGFPQPQSWRCCCNASHTCSKQTCPPPKQTSVEVEQTS